MIRGDIQQRIGGGVGGQADGVPFIAWAKDRQHDKTRRPPTPLAKGLAEIGV